MNLSLDEEVRFLVLHLRMFEERGIEAVDFNEEFNDVKKSLQEKYIAILNNLKYLHSQVLSDEFEKLAEAPRNSETIRKLERLVAFAKRDLERYRMIATELDKMVDDGFAIKMSWDTKTQSPSDDEDESFYDSTQLEAECVECGEKAMYKCAHCGKGFFCGSDCFTTARASRAQS